MKQTFGGLQQSREELASQAEWLRRQLFGANSERRILDEFGHQMILDVVRRAERAAEPEIEIAAHDRRRAVTANEIEPQPTRFDETVPVVVIELGKPRDHAPRKLDAGGREGDRAPDTTAGFLRGPAYVRKVYKRKTEAGVRTP